MQGICRKDAYEQMCASFLQFKIYPSRKRERNAIMLCSELRWIVCTSVGGRRPAWQQVVLACFLISILNLTAVFCETYSRFRIDSSVFCIACVWHCRQGITEVFESFLHLRAIPFSAQHRSPNREELCAFWVVLFLELLGCVTLFTYLLYRKESLI